MEKAKNKPKPSKTLPKKASLAVESDLPTVLIGIFYLINIFMPYLTLLLYYQAPPDYVNYMEKAKNKTKPKPIKDVQKEESIKDEDLPTALIGIFCYILLTYIFNKLRQI